MESISNKVMESGLITIDPADFISNFQFAEFDIKPLLIEELLLKEKDFREFVKQNNWSVYSGKYVAVFCSNDAIIPVWAYMLLAVALEPFAKKIYYGSISEMTDKIFLEQIRKLNAEDYRDKRIVIKGCGDVFVPPSAYVELTRILKPVVKSLMFGEPCSTVPVYKNG